MFPPIALTLMFTAITVGLSTEPQCLSTGNAEPRCGESTGSSSFVQKDHKLGRSTAFEAQHESQSRSPLRRVVQRFVTNISGDPQHQSLMAYVSVDANNLVSGKDCICTFDASFPCDIGGGQCSSKSNKAGCEADGGQFCGPDPAPTPSGGAPAPTPPACPCDWAAPDFPCFRNGKCSSHGTQQSCEAAGGDQFCGTDPAPTPGGSAPAPSPPVCGCTFDPKYPCSKDGKCNSLFTQLMCETSGGEFCGVPSPTPPPFSGTLDTEMQAAFDEHNRLRAKHNVADLIWDEELANQAQSWASGCKDEHSGSGENLWAGTGTGSAFSGAAAVGSWYKELTTPGYDFSSPGSQAGTGHFTQVVWKSTTRVGCAVQNCEPLEPEGWNPANFFVCEYYPAGNYPGGYAGNVLQAA